MGGVGRYGDGSLEALRAEGIVECYQYGHLVTNLLDLVNLFLGFCLIHSNHEPLNGKPDSIL